MPATDAKKVAKRMQTASKRAAVGEKGHDPICEPRLPSLSCQMHRLLSSNTSSFGAAGGVHGLKSHDFNGIGRACGHVLRNSPQKRSHEAFKVID